MQVIVTSRAVTSVRRHCRESFLEKLTAQLAEKYSSLVLYTNEEMQKEGNSFAVLRQLESGLSEEKLLFVYIDGRQLSNFLKNAGDNILGLVLT
mgnify:CR=1 FL=1